VQFVGLHEPLQRIHLAERVGDGRARRQDQFAPGIDVGKVSALDEQIPCPLRAGGIDALEVAQIGRESEFAELLGLVDQNLVDADLADMNEVILAGLQVL